MAGAAIHLVFLAVNTAAVRLLGLGGPRGAARAGDGAAVGVQRAVILVASQKTLPVSPSSSNMFLTVASLPKTQDSQDYSLCMLLPLQNSAKPDDVFWQCLRPESAEKPCCTALCTCAVKSVLIVRSRRWR